MVTNESRLGTVTSAEDTSIQWRTFYLIGSHFTSMEDISSHWRTRKISGVWRPSGKDTSLQRKTLGFSGGIDTFVELMSEWIFHVYHNTIRALKLFKRSISCNSNGFHFIGEYFNGQHFIRQYTLKYPPLKYPPLKCPPLTFPILKSPPLICPPLKCPPLICPPLITLFGIIVPNFGTSMPRYPWNYTEIGSFFKMFWNWLPNTGICVTPLVSS